MKKIRLILSALALVLGLSAEAQLVKTTKGYNTIGIDYRSTSIYGSAKSSGLLFNFDTDDRTDGFSLSYLRGISVSGSLPMFIEVGGALNFADGEIDQKKFPFAGMQTEKMQVTNLSFDIPVNFTYKFKWKNGWQVSPFVGAFARIHAYAHGKIAGIDTDLFEKMDGDINRIQFGGQIGINGGYKRLNMRIAYQIESDLVNTRKDGGDGVAFSGSAFVTGIGITF